MAEVLREEYMSSEESAYDEDTKDLVQYNVKELAWESTKLTKRKKKLDKIHHKSKSACSQKRSVKRVRDKTLSLRPKPDDCPAWACNNNYSIISLFLFKISDITKFQK